LGLRIAGDAEELLLEGASMIERQDVEAAVVTERHGYLPFGPNSLTLLIRAPVPISLRRVEAAVLLDALTGAQEARDQQEHEHRGDPRGDACSDRKAPDQVMAAADDAERNRLRLITAVRPPHDDRGHRDDEADGRSRSEQRQDEAAGAPRAGIS